MSKNTSTSARLDALENRFDRIEAMLARLVPDEPARTVTPAKAEPQPKAEVKFRNAKAKAKGAEQAADIWARHYAAAGVKRFKDLTPAQQKAAKAEVAAAWKAIPGTRKTKLA